MEISKSIYPKCAILGDKDIYISKSKPFRGDGEHAISQIRRFGI